MHQLLKGYAMAVLADARQAPGERDVAEDLNAVAHLVSRTSSLATALTDFGIPTSSRQGVLRDRGAEEVVRLELADCLPQGSQEVRAEQQARLAGARAVGEQQGPKLVPSHPGGCLLLLVAHGGNL